MKDSRKQYDDRVDECYFRDVKGAKSTWLARGAGLGNILASFTVIGRGRMRVTQGKGLGQVRDQEQKEKMMPKTHRQKQK